MKTVYEIYVESVINYIKSDNNRKTYLKAYNNYKKTLKGHQLNNLK
jgi:hypothetical protein